MPYACGFVVPPPIVPAPPLHYMLITAALLLGLAPLIATAPQAEGPAPSARELALELTGTARLAGTSGSLVGARRVARRLEQAGWKVELDERVVLLALPRRLELGIFADADATEPLARRSDRFDPDAIPAGDVPLFNAWSASAAVRAPVIAVGHGLRADYAELAERGVDVRGCIALVKYGRSYRGVKVDLAEEYGCVGVLLYSDGDGAERGEVWPFGPWKPDWAGQRGSISPMAKVPGDPSTPGTPSPAPGETAEARLSDAQLRASLPALPCLPIGTRHARVILAHLASVDVEGAALPSGPGPVEVSLDLEVPRDYRTIRNVIARLPGSGPGLVIAGSHRDAWVRGGHDSGSGVVAILRAAQHLGERAAAGWTPEHTIVLGLWDAEEFGLIGSTEWAEANADLLREHAHAYVNADAAISGTRFGASGTPGMLSVLSSALERVPAPESEEAHANLLEQWLANSPAAGPRLGLPGSGSDFAVFLHHLTIPMLDIGLRGNSGGQYHTAFDDFAVVDRFLDPDWAGHELGGRVLAELLAELSSRPRAGFDSAEACLDMARRVRVEGLDGPDDEGPSWLGAARADRLAAAFETAAGRAGADDAPGGPPVYRMLEAPEGLPTRAWFRNRMWAPGLETGYSSEFLPGLRSASTLGEAELDLALADLIAAVERIEQP